MTTSSVPVKTPLGLQELRQRTQGLGQRHRTVLLIVDGRRPLAEVLSMAHQAGATAAHFEELVRLGMIELPLPPIEVPPVVESPPAQSVAPEDGAQAAVAEPVVEVVPAEAQQASVAAADLPPAIAEAPAESARKSRAAGVATEPIRGVRRKASGSGRSAAPGRAGASRPAPLATGSAEAAIPTPPALPMLEPAAAADDVHKLAEARGLLADVLRRDTLLHRLLAPARVQQAQTQDDLIALVWEIERGRAHARRKRGQLLALQRARELLGMGNTLVAEDTLPFEPSRLPDE